MEMDEIYKKIYKNEAEKESDQIELQMFDVENNEMGEVQKIHSIATDRHIQAMLNNYKYSFSLDYEKELEELKEMEEWQIEATFGLYDITDPRQWEEYLEYEIKWIKHIEKFSIEWMTSLDRPLIFRDLLSFFGQDWDLEGFQKKRYESLCLTASTLQLLLLLWHIIYNQYLLTTSHELQGRLLLKIAKTYQCDHMVLP